MATSAALAIRCAKEDVQMIYANTIPAQQSAQRRPFDVSAAIAKDKENLAHVPIRKDIWKEVRSTFEATGSDSRKLSPSSGIISTGGYAPNV